MKIRDLGMRYDNHRHIIYTYNTKHIINDSCCMQVARCYVDVRLNDGVSIARSYVITTLSLYINKYITSTYINRNLYTFCESTLLTSRVTNVYQEVITRKKVFLQLLMIFSWFCATFGDFCVTKSHTKFVHQKSQKIHEKSAKVAKSLYS